MVELTTARAGLEALAAAIAEMSEDVQDAAVRPVREGGKERWTALIGLRCLAEDVAALATAMEVLQRRASPSRRMRS